MVLEAAQEGMRLIIQKLTLLFEGAGRLRLPRIHRGHYSFCTTVQQDILVKCVLNSLEEFSLMIQRNVNPSTENMS
jgi:hypothetical protein